MAFLPGDLVHVASVGKGHVREVRNGGRYLVEVRGLAVVVDEDQLNPMDGTKRRSAPPAPPPVAVPARPHAPTTIDLHGMRVEEAVAAIDVFLSDAALAGHAELRIIHGRSGGRLKSAVHARLKQLRVVRAFRVDPGNAGVTVVTL